MAEFIERPRRLGGDSTGTVSRPDYRLVVVLVVAVVSVELAMLTAKVGMALGMLLVEIIVEGIMLIAELGMLFAVLAVEPPIEVPSFTPRVVSLVVEPGPLLVGPGMEVFVLRLEILMTLGMLGAQILMEVPMVAPELLVESVVVFRVGAVVMRERRIRQREGEKAR